VVSFEKTFFVVNEMFTNHPEQRVELNKATNTEFNLSLLHKHLSYNTSL